MPDQPFVAPSAEPVPLDAGLGGAAVGEGPDGAGSGLGPSSLGVGPGQGLGGPDGWPLPFRLDELDALAPEALTGGLPARLVGALDALLAVDLRGHPWTQLLTAAACHDARRGDPLALELFDAAWSAFYDAGDIDGLGVAANVRANIALGRGDIPDAVAWWRRAETLLGRTTDLGVSVAAHSSLEAYFRGDLRTAEQSAREALLLADGGDAPGDAIVPLVYLALYAFCLGDFGRAGQILEAAEELLTSLTGVEARNEGALVATFAGVVEAVRGTPAEADRHFDEALRRAEADETPWYGTMARALRAEFTAQWAPHRSLADARRAQQDADAVGDTWWSAFARMAEGVALTELGELDVAEVALCDAVARLQNPVERAFAQTHLGEVRLRRADRPGAREALEQARAAFEASGARYWATRAAIAMGAADRDRGGRWLRLARTTAAGDPVYERLFAPAQDLRISVLGPPSVTLEGQPVVFLTRHAELAVYLLALAGSSGLPAEELCATLWPGVDERRAGPRMRTMLWQVRNALGPEAWRVQRRRERVLIDLTGVEVDLDEARLAHEELAAAADGVSSAAPAAAGCPALLDGWDVSLPPSLAHLSRP